MSIDFSQTEVISAMLPPAPSTPKSLREASKLVAEQKREADRIEQAEKGALRQVMLAQAKSLRDEKLQYLP